ncbi:MAG: 16S rRNA (guanine(527)-N(7))-methyltransferase RsmG [Bacteroidetes bacterium]|nr:16S rRNA (guanine(527)-N(7))-methyltransferase RsmG [Bacteroidota bacterium]MCB0603810.1 16S rRNA (guanine(527)-N(7))-methyltransferase RsmG [Saprospiraceae bacterium]MCO5277518.1 16S rRNA (guanine(527)-N(7))-methyltransferase RsmG [Saprospiraceae bacterium]HRG43258.1 16S rRNA (guanine(527)-N(7))-methyltransferase RsmG [Saprospiraceae bacterium]
MEIILKYFKNLSDRQKEQFAQLMPLYKEWNEKINLISRKDIDYLYTHHVLHSLAIAKYVNFKPGAKVMDLGTGGGFPAIPLAILFPETQFYAVDSIAKKIKVVGDISERLNLTNVEAIVSRAESMKIKVDFVVTRAVAELKELTQWSMKHISQQEKHAIPNGLIALKGPMFKQEAKLLPKGDFVDSYAISKYFPESYFEEKYIVYVQGRG